MITHPNYSKIPSSDELRSLVREANRERAHYIRGAVGRLMRTIAGLGVRHGGPSFPHGTLAGRR